MQAWIYEKIFSTTDVQFTNGILCSSSFEVHQATPSPSVLAHGADRVQELHDEQQTRVAAYHRLPLACGYNSIRGTIHATAFQSHYRFEFTTDQCYDWVKFEEQSHQQIEIIPGYLQPYQGRRWIYLPLSP
jgi:hypothetical protein